MDNPVKQNQLNKLKSKKVLAVAAVFLVLVIFGAVLVLGKQQGAPVDDSMIQTNDLPKLAPEEIGMVVTVRKDKKALMFELTKATDITHVAYTIEYQKMLDGQKLGDGLLGEMNIADDGITKTDFREFGTCSSGTCKYDKVVSDITIKLAVTKTDGKQYQVEKVVKL